MATLSSMPAQVNGIKIAKGRGRGYRRAMPWTQFQPPHRLTTTQEALARLRTIWNDHVLGDKHPLGICQYCGERCEAQFRECSDCQSANCP
jgi:hypothetical protein